jgi:putative ABC transport system substrate-binding protein
MSIHLRRREFIAGLGAAAAWPLAARAQQAQRLRRIGVLIAGNENDPLVKTAASAFVQALAGLGWTDGRNVRMELRWAGGDIQSNTSARAGIGRFATDIILTLATPATAAVQRETRTIPIVFAGVGDPVASGLVPRLNQPGRNITGFANLEATLTAEYANYGGELLRFFR